MAGVSGPLMSFDASGKLAGSIVFSKWKGRNYVRQLVTPHNPRSASQTGMRAMFAFCAQQWASIAAGDQATWEDLAEAGNFSPFNAFMKENQTNWRDFLAPSEPYPAGRTNAPALETAPSATASGRNILVADTAGAGANQWGIAIFRGLAPAFTPNWDNCITTIAVAGGAAWSYTDGPLDPDTYYYQMIYFADDGNQDAPGTEVNATVT